LVDLRRFAAINTSLCEIATDNEFDPGSVALPRLKLPMIFMGENLLEEDSFLIFINVHSFELSRS
jgi:hypothetical protein